MGYIYRARKNLKFSDFQTSFTQINFNMKPPSRVPADNYHHNDYHEQVVQKCNFQGICFCNVSFLLGTGADEPETVSVYCARKSFLEYCLMDSNVQNPKLNLYVLLFHMTSAPSGHTDVHCK